MHVFFYFKVVLFLFLFCHAIYVCTYVVRNEEVQWEKRINSDKKYRNVQFSRKTP